MRVCNEACKERRNSTLYEMKKTSGQRYKKITLVLLYCKNLFRGFGKDSSKIKDENVICEKKTQKIK